MAGMRETLCETTMLLVAPNVSGPTDEDAPTVETRLRQELRECAVTLRKLAYTLPHGVGEYALLRLSEQMTTTADQVA